MLTRVFRVRQRLPVAPRRPLVKPLVIKRLFSTPPPPIELIKNLRKETQAGVIDCKEALMANNNDLEGAKQWLVNKAKITAAKKSGRLAQDGS